VIVPMKKVSFVGVETEKSRFLSHLQELGCIHLIQPKEPAEPGELIRERQRVAEVRRFLARKAKGEPPAKVLDHRQVCERREQLGQEEAALLAEIVLLGKQRAAQTPWGDFSIRDIDALKEKGLHIGFYRTARRTYESLNLESVFHQVVSEKGSEVCFVTFGPKPPPIDLIEEPAPPRSLSEIEGDIREKERKILRIEDDYAGLSAHVAALERAERTLTDLIEFERAVLNAGSELGSRLFVLQCWTPLTEAQLLERIDPSFRLYHYHEEPLETDRMPVQLKNPPAFDSGEDLVRIYSHPSHRDIDPSPFVLYCFTVFFGMIVGDFGYGLVLLAMALWLKRKVRQPSALALRLFRLMTLLSGSVIVWGVLGAGFFGMDFAPGSPIRRFSLLDFNTSAGQKEVMIVSILIGMIHICLSLVIKVYKERQYGGVGWILAIWSGYFYLNDKMAHGVANQPALYGLITGLTVVFLLSTSSRNPLIRVAEGILGLLGIVQIFADILSYLRLFALGIATVYIAQTFNILAGSVSGAVPVLGILFAALILFVGHTINIGLAIMGGVIHGLRLNFLEWYRWCFEGDGLPYKPFQRIGVASFSDLQQSN
jgi:V/A-type H+/Na+-transporting ATPase subunit I